MRTLSLSSLLLVLGLGLTACGDKDDTDAPEGDTDTDADTDTDTDTDVSACGAWSGIEGVGTSWSYDVADGDLSGTVDNEITAYDASTGLVTTLSVSALTGVDYSLDSTTTSEYRCDGDGMWLLTQYTEYAMDYAGTPIDGWTDSSYDPPALLLPVDIAVGDSWTTSYTGVTETSMTDPDTFSSTVQQTVVEERNVTVPAGTYDTMYVEYTGDGDGFTYIARGVGQVKSNITELTSYQP